MQENSNENIKATDDIAELPTTLRNLCLVYFGCCFVAVVITILMLIVVGFKLNLFFVGVAIAAFCGIFAVRKTKEFLNGNYMTVRGTCIDSYLTGKFKWKMRDILIATEDNDTYSFSVSAQRSYRVLAGDKVIVYIPSGTQYYEKDGVKVIPAFYGYERIR